VLVSAVKGWGLNKLKEKISANLRKENACEPEQALEENAF